MFTSQEVSAQLLSSPPDDSQYKYSTPLPPGVAAPDTLDSSFGKLHIFHGFPDKASVEKLYDYLDFKHAVQVYLLALPVVNQVSNRDAILQMGAVKTNVPIWESMVQASPLIRSHSGLQFLRDAQQSGSGSMEDYEFSRATVNEIWDADTQDFRPVAVTLDSIQPMEIHPGVRLYNFTQINTPFKFGGES
jgi:hypothetical protein